MWNAISLVQDLNSCRRVHFIPRARPLKGISQKVNLVARVGFELTYYDISVLHISHDATGDYILSHLYVFCKAVDSLI